jgi:iron(III) transport system ATP-binding protein
MIGTRASEAPTAEHPDEVLRCEGLRKRFGSTAAVDGFDLEVRGGDLMALLGPSGCGKTTALRLIAGLERPDAGTVRVQDRVVASNATWVPPERRRVGMVFQEWALFPHLDVAANVAFGLNDGDPRPRVEELLKLARLEGLARRMPHELSGGQQQRVALARALAPSPDLLLLDEPFSNLDAQLRAEVRGQVRALLRATGTTAVFVTPEQEEALSIADQVAVMIEGRLRQSGTPFDVYTMPVDAGVARLVGQANLVPADVREGRARSVLGEVAAPGLPDGPCEILVRPEAITIRADERGGARVIDVEFYGHDQLVRCDVNGGPIQVRLVGAHPEFVVGAAVSLELRDRALVLPT